MLGHPGCRRCLGRNSIRFRICQLGLSRCDTAEEFFYRLSIVHCLAYPYMKLKRSWLQIQLFRALFALSVLQAVYALDTELHAVK